MKKEPIPLLGDAGITVAADGEWILRPDVDRVAFQAILTGTGAVTATFDVECSNDGVTACDTPLANLALSGSDSVSDGFASTGHWNYVRVASPTAFTGTGKTLKVSMFW